MGTYRFTCRRCGGDSSALKHPRGNRREICDTCLPLHRKEWHAAYGKANRAKARARNRAWRKRDPIGARSAQLRYYYGVTGDQYQTLLEAQDGCCAICGRPERTTHKGKVRQLGVDHCHKTGNVRGLLCHHCNAALGHFEDRPDLLRAAIKYLSC